MMVSHETGILGDAWVGRSMRRLEDPALVRGQGRFTADLPADLHVCFVRSPVAAGRVLDITAPADVRLLRLRDLGPVNPIKPIVHRPDYQAIAQPILASEFVRFVGELIAAVLAPTTAEAEDAAERVRVDIEVTSHVTDIDAALAPDAPLVHPGTHSNVIVEGHIEAPDLSALLATAAAVIELEVISHRQNATPMEVRGIHAAYDTTSRRIVATCATQNPHVMRTGIADVLGIPESELR